MRLAIIADIQGNAAALEAVLHDSHIHQTDMILCLGDIATGPEPAAALALLREHDVVSVRGNMDDVILNPVPYAGDDETLRRYAEIDQWCSSQLSRHDRDDLAALSLSYAVDLGGVTCLGCHGSPRANDDVIEATTPDDALAVLLADVDARLVAVGHMHTPMLRDFRGTQIVNPGSIGLPFGGKRPMPARAEYALIGGADGDVTISFRSIAYDSGLLRQRILASGMPHAAWYLSLWQV